MLKATSTPATRATALQASVVPIGRKRKASDTKRHSVCPAGAGRPVQNRSARYATSTGGMLMDSSGPGTPRRSTSTRTNTANSRYSAAQSVIQMSSRMNCVYRSSMTEHEVPVRLGMHL